MPWSLSLAYDCMDMQTGKIDHLPFKGTILDNAPIIISNMRHSWRAYNLFHKKIEDHNKSDKEFLQWLQKS